MSWYKFWKRSGPAGFLDEQYKWYDDKYYPTKKSVLAECEYWAGRVGGGFNTHYSYGFEQVNFPPKSVLEKMIKAVKDGEEGSKKRLQFLTETLYNSQTTQLNLFEQSKEC
jgi:hypothetical protein